MAIYQKLEVAWAENPKVQSVSVNARWLWIAALCYAGRNETDGVIPRGALVSISGFGLAPARRAVAELLGVVLFEEHPLGFLIHDYLNHQRSREQIYSIRQAKKEAGALGGAASTAASVVARGLKQKPTQRTEDRGQQPETETDNSSSSARARLAREFYEGVTKRKPENAVMEQMLDDIDFAHGDVCVAAVFGAAAAKDDPWPYAKRIFDSCLLEGHEPRKKPETRRQNGRTDKAKSDLADSPFAKFGT